MPAYVVFCQRSVHDEAAMSRYRSAAIELLPKQNVKVIAGPQIREMLEGAPFQNSMVLEFETVELAQAWYYSPEYQALADIRKQAADGLAFIVESPSLG